jgi:hypothetical protein
MTANLVKISIDGDPEFPQYSAKVVDRWNGFVVPAFPHSEVERFAAELAGDNDDDAYNVKIHYDGNARQWVVTQWDLVQGRPANGIDDVWVDRISASAEGLFKIDLGLVWDVVEEPEPETSSAYVIKDEDLFHAILALRAAGENALADRLLSASTL